MRDNALVQLLRDTAWVVQLQLGVQIVKLRRARNQEVAHARVCLGTDLRMGEAGWRWAEVGGSGLACAASLS